MIATRTKAAALSSFIVCAVTAGMVIGATQVTPGKVEIDPPSQAKSTTGGSKAPHGQSDSARQAATAEPSDRASAHDQLPDEAPKQELLRGQHDAMRGMMDRLAMREGAFGGGNAGAADSDFRDRLDIAQLAAALPTWEKNPKNEVILKKLETPIPMPFANETPLDDVLKHIKSTFAKHESTPIPIYVDPLGLQQAERSMNSTIQIDLEGIPLKTTLRLILRQLGLAYCVRDGVLIISSVQGVREELAEAARELLGTGNEKVDLQLLVPMGVGPRGMMRGVGMGSMGGMM